VPDLSDLIKSTAPASPYYFNADLARNLPGIPRPAPGDLGPSFGQPDIDCDPFVLPVVLLDRDLFPGANAHLRPRASPALRGPFPEKQAAGPGNPPEIELIL
jgi:hypothetical protein